MSRKHYNEAARIIREADYLTDEARARLVSDLVTMFADDNPRFLPSKFRAACEPEQEEEQRFSVVENAPGYLPEGEPATFATLEEAEQHASEVVGSILDDYCDATIEEYGIPRLAHAERESETLWRVVFNAPMHGERERVVEIIES